MRRASYRYGVEWLAENDETSATDPDEIASFVTTLLLADLFGVEPARVARDVLRKRKQLAKQS